MANTHSHGDGVLCLLKKKKKAVNSKHMQKRNNN